MSRLTKRKNEGVTGFDGHTQESNPRGILRTFDNAIGLKNTPEIRDLLQCPKNIAWNRNANTVAKYDSAGRLEQFSRTIPTAIRKRLFTGTYTTDTIEYFDIDKDFEKGIRVKEKYTIKRDAANLPDHGTFTIEFDGNKTDPIPWNAPQLAIQTALNNAKPKSLSDLKATGTIGGGITIKFDGKYAYTHQEKPKINTKLLTKGGIGLTPADIDSKERMIDQKQLIKVVGNRPTGGYYTLSFNGITTGPIPHDANTVEINTILKAAQLEELQATGSMTTNTGITILFTGQYADDHQPTIIVNSAELTTGGVGIAPAIVEDLLVNQKQKITLPAGVVPDGGNYTLTFSGHTTTPLAHNADAATITNALMIATGVPAGVNATGDLLTGIEFTFAGAYMNKYQAPMTIDTSTLTQAGVAITRNASVEDTVTNHEQAITLPGGTPPDKGTYTLAFAGNKTLPIAYNATVGVINDALRNAELGDIQVVGDLLAGITIKFIGIYANKYNNEKVTIDTKRLQSGGIVLAPAIPNGTDIDIKQEQKITLGGLIPDRGTYTLSFNGNTTEKIPFDANKDIINAKLRDRGLDNVKVEGSLKDGIVIRFYGAYANAYIPVANQVQIDPNDLRIGGNAILDPKVERIQVGNIHYCIVKERNGSQFYALLKETAPGVWALERNNLFKRYELIEGGIRYQEIAGAPRTTVDNLRQKSLRKVTSK